MILVGIAVEVCISLIGKYYFQALASTGSSYSMYIDECACTTKTSNLSDGLCREIASKAEL